MALFQEFWRGVLARPWKETISCGQRRYARSPYRQRMLLFDPRAHWWRSWNKPYKIAIKPIRVTTNWNLIAWTVLWPLYSMHWSFLGLQVRRTVPSMNPQQLSNDDPLAWIVSAKVEDWQAQATLEQMSPSATHKVYDMITDKTKFWHKYSESTDHVRMSAWIGKSF